MEARGIPALFELREGQQVRLAGGDSSSTFLPARHGRVEKFYNNQAEAQHEWKMVQCVMALARQYTASPASLSVGSGHCRRAAGCLSSL